MPKEGSRTPGSALGHRQGSLAGPAGHIASPRCRGTQSTSGSGLVLTGELKYSRRARTRIQPSCLRCSAEGGSIRTRLWGEQTTPRGSGQLPRAPLATPRAEMWGRSRGAQRSPSSWGPVSLGSGAKRGPAGHGRIPPDAGRLPKHEDFQSPLKSHLELSPGIKPGLSLVRFSISAPACFSKKFFKGSGRSF